MINNWRKGVRRSKCVPDEVNHLADPRSEAPKLLQLLNRNRKQKLLDNKLQQSQRKWFKYRTKLIREYHKTEIELVNILSNDLKESFYQCQITHKEWFDNFTRKFKLKRIMHQLRLSKQFQNNESIPDQVLNISQLSQIKTKIDKQLLCLVLWYVCVCLCEQQSCALSNKDNYIIVQMYT